MMLSLSISLSASRRMADYFLSKRRVALRRSVRRLKNKYAATAIAATAMMMSNMSSVLSVMANHLFEGYEGRQRGICKCLDNSDLVFEQHYNQIFGSEKDCNRNLCPQKPQMVLHCCTS